MASSSIDPPDTHDPDLAATGKSDGYLSNHFQSDGFNITARLSLSPVV